MVLPTGTISFADINVELGRPSNQAISINDSLVRGIADKSSGSISMNDLRGKSYLRVTGGSTLVSGTGGRLGAGNVTATTTQATIGTVEGGTAPYTFAWEFVSGDSASVNTSSSSTTTFSRTVAVTVGSSITRSGIYRCKVTDANGISVYGPNCTVFTTHTETS